ncbi:MAG TPA: hypothetical protein VFW89_05605 [Gemmatimonadaceae bacterium]|nr:hypothetical protein [Gemmatimonadaceae bacterium]
MEQNGWNDHDDSASSPPNERRWSPEVSLGDPDAWRGEAHAPLDDSSWRGEAEQPAGDDSWRGDEHGEEWPEWNAGPEYRMWKRIQGKENPD